MENSPKKQPIYTLGEEVFNSVTHAIGVFFAVSGLTVMIVFSALYGDGYALASSIVYGVTMFVLYLMSTLYHSFTHHKVKKVFRVLDHCSIFMLIAGTYTPFCLITLRENGGIPLFLAIWGVAIFGIVLNIISIEKYKKLSLICYLAMGWAIVFTLKPLIALLHPNGLLLLVIGGALYTFGVIFYVAKKYRYMHSIWHMFVLAGTVVHYFSILIYVLPITF